MNHQQQWPQERVDMLAALCAQGLPSKEIGQRIGVSKNAVISKARRLGVRLRHKPVVPRAPKVPKPPRGYQWTAERVALLRLMWEEEKAGLFIAALLEAPIASVYTKASRLGLPRRVKFHPVPPPEPFLSFEGGKALADLTRHDCCFPISPHESRQHRFCGERVRANSPYCEGHHAVAYRAAPAAPIKEEN